MTATIHHGDCLDVLRNMPDNSVDAICCDPPYGLSNTTPNQVADMVTRWVTGDREYVPAGKGFMGAAWDASVPPVAVWDECLRVLKPGGHLVAFAGSRTQDLMGLAIRLAGFDIRENLAWLYGSGFPKSMDISKAIDKRGGASHLTAEIGEAIKTARESRGWSRKRADEHFCGGSTNWSWFEGRPTGQRPPTPETFAKIVAEWPELADYASKVVEAEREVIGKSAHKSGIGNAAKGHYTVGGTVAEAYDITAPGTPEAEKWQGWGTALKPAHEPIILARKPFPGTVAQNTLTWGTGGLNIDATRISSTDNLKRVGEGGAFLKDGCESLEQLRELAARGEKTPNGRDARATLARIETRGGVTTGSDAGRWPANVVLDPDTAKALDQQSGTLKSGALKPYQQANREHYSGSFPEVREVNTPANEGGASRFFKVVEPDPPFMYAAKAPKKERPTVKRTVLRLRDDITPEQVDHVQARLREAGVKPL